MGTSVNNIVKGGGQSKGVGDVFQGGGAGVSDSWGGDVGYGPPNVLGLGWVPIQGRSTDN